MILATSVFAAWACGLLVACAVLLAVEALDLGAEPVLAVGLLAARATLFLAVAGAAGSTVGVLVAGVTAAMGLGLAGLAGAGVVAVVGFGVAIAATDSVVAGVMAGSAM